MWDWIVSLPDEVTILRKSGIRLPIVAYMISRYLFASNRSTFTTHYVQTGHSILHFYCCDVSMYVLFDT
jgi:phage gp36-like protein